MPQVPETMTFEVWYTSAPKDYDGFGTITAIEFDKTMMYDSRERPLRKVLILPKNSTWQLMRYSSGLFACYTDSDLRTLGIIP
jgi:hypothetical protein